MHRSVRLIALAAALGVASTAEVQAQETRTPVFQAPYRAFNSHELGASVSFPDAADFGIEGFYRYGFGTNDLGVRGGFVQPEGEGDAVIVLGGNFRTRVLSATESFPLDGALTLGLGAAIGDGDDIFSIPIGVSLGRRLLLDGSRTSFVPYVHPVIIPTIGGEDDEVGFALGLGVDIRFSETLDLRVNAGIGDIEGVGLSLAFVR